VRIDGDDYRVGHVFEGDSVAEVLSMAESGRFMKRYEEALEGYTYLTLN
jgi:hypothetical protein